MESVRIEREEAPRGLPFSGHEVRAPRDGGVLFVAGTRPELIKIYPVVKELRRAHPELRTQVCMTRQHKELLDPVLRDFDFRPDLLLPPRPEGGGLASELSRILTSLTMLFAEERPGIVVVQGDTTTTLAGALAAHYQQIPVAHVEAGLRTSHRYAPFPEEMNRRLATHLSVLHFAPTEWAHRNLLAEGVNPTTIHVTGNTVIDVLLEVAHAEAVAPPP